MVRCVLFSYICYIHVLIVVKLTAVKSYLGDLCVQWEEPLSILIKRGVRCVVMRIGVVLHPSGGILQHQLPQFNFGLGGVMGDGTQYFSWMSLRDFLGVLDFVIAHDAISGPVNFVSPNPVTNYEYTKTLGKVLSRYVVMLVVVALCCG